MLFAAWAGCAAFNGAKLPDPDEPPDGGTTSSSSSSSSSSGCADGVRVPRVGPAPSGGTGGDIEIVVAVQAISLGLENGRIDRSFGYDLDGVCTCAADRASCAPRNEAADAGSCDGDKGRDNGTGVLMASLSAFVNDPASYANEALASGERGIILRVEGYNGQPNDDVVRFSIYRAHSETTPRFDEPSFPWDVDKDDVKTNSAGTDRLEAVTAANGFVLDNLLVINDLETSKIPFNSDSDLLLKQVRLTAKLEKDPTTGRWNFIDGIAVGRWPLEDAIQTVARVRDPSDDEKRFCDNALLFAAARAKICGAADIMEGPSQDGTNATCDALSTAVGLRTVPAALGVRWTPTRGPTCVGKDLGGCP